MLSQKCNYYYLMLVSCMLNLALNRVKVFQQGKTESQPITNYLWHKAFARVIIGVVVVHNLNMLSSFTLPTQREAPAGDDCRQSCSYTRKRKTETDSQEQRTGRKLVEILVSL